MSRRRFGGWEPQTVTSYEYDTEGRVTATTTVTEPEWDDEERGWAYALAMVEARACSGCGLPQSQTWGEDAHEGAFEGTFHLCMACWTKSQTHELGVKSRKGIPPAAVKVRLKDRRREG